MSSWLNKSFLPYFVLLLLLPAIYFLFGHYTAANVPAWSSSFKHSVTDRMEVNLSREDLERFGYLFALGVILLINLSLTLMSKPMALIFTSWFKSDFRAILSVLGWSFGVVLIVRWIHYFLRLFLLLCVAILACLELQDKGYNKWIIFLVLSLLTFTSFALGVWLLTKSAILPETQDQGFSYIYPL